MTSIFSKSKTKLAGVSIAAISLALGSHAYAQDTAPSDDVEAVVVTGSRVARAGFVAPTPTTVVSTEILSTRAETNIGGILNTLPAFKADYSPAASGPRSFGSPGATFANLRSLGSQRTLSLVDGRRLTPSAIEGQADLNLIPSLLIQNVDVVTGGASAAYGSDAVAGVVNIRLRKNLQGFLGNVSYGQSKYDDLKDTFLALAYGTSFAGGRGHFMIGGEYDRNKGTGDAYTRPWGQEEWGLIPGAAGQPANVLVQNRHGNNQAPGGLVQSGPLKGLVFTPGGGTRQYQYGNPISGSFQVGGEGQGEAYTSLLMNPLKRRNVLARVDYDFSSRLSAYVEASWAKSNSLSRGSAPSDTTTATLPAIQITNPFLPAAVRTLMQNANVTTLNVGRRNDDLGIYMADVRTEVQRYVAGASGEIGGGWRWDGFVQYGKTDYFGGVLNSRNQANWRLGTDVVANPAAGGVAGVAAGAPVCRSTLTAPTNGCVPINIFGNGSISEAARNYVMGTQTYDLTYKQTVAAFNIHGSPFSTWAGEVSLATGLEHRDEKVSAVTDPISAIGGWHVGNQRPINGRIKVTEGYVEALTPLLRDYPIAKLLELNTAVRLTDYSTSGRVTTWKVGVNWELNDQVRLRGTRSRDIRAANMSELFAQGVSAQQPIQDPVTKITLGTTNLTVGNPTLTPEKADTWTIGIVVKPSVIPGLDLSVDRYDIDLKSAIANLTGQRIVDLCAAGTTSLCPYIQRTNGVITQVTLARFNIASIRSTGYDFEARYRSSLDGIFGANAGNITLQYLGTRTTRLRVNDLQSVIDYTGDVGNNQRGAYGQPKWRWTFMTTYDRGPFSTTATVRYVGGGNMNNTWGPAQIADNRVASRTYFDLAASYNLLSRGNQTAQIYAIAQNITDKEPPVVPTQVSQTNPVIYDVIGRQYRVGIRFSF